MSTAKRKTTFWNRYGMGTKSQKVVDFLQEGACIVDVREYIEYKRGHAPGSYNLPMSDIFSYLNQLSELGYTNALVCCQNGSRARIATEILIDHGIFAINVGGWENASRYHDLSKIKDLEI